MHGELTQQKAFLILTVFSISQYNSFSKSGGTVCINLKKPSPTAYSGFLLHVHLAYVTYIHLMYTAEKLRVTDAIF